MKVETKLVAKDLGIVYLRNDFIYRDTAKEQGVIIQSTLDSEECILGNGNHGSWHGMETTIEKP